MANTTTPPLWEQQQARLAAYQDAKYNFDPERSNEYTAESGWRIDDYQTELLAEQPGPPEEHGSWQAAQVVLRRYSFPPPDLITGIFPPDSELDHRIMVLRAQFLFFTFWFGVRIGGVTNEQRTTNDGQQEQVWGYNYRTLEGHFERGEIEFTVHKNLTTGQVVFHVHAYSQLGSIRNPFYWIGFRLFGRMLQRRFAQESLKRMRKQVDDLVNGNEPWPTASQIAASQQDEKNRSDRKD
ncbi:DUF1990 domain-containing protein [Hymenobacter sp. NBH84]|uniref:DUF1990 domain-containing protein n=1 Tax=Hymenobacter sp. NBH84 TaxID=2596915 RepID=UPI0016238C58|nr:DUF1990 domain-containing protein [Hymenobacter sp. NBH84]QNE38219.1 DUF1990 domain-containing protein [Hymenobacter sp. NBH84]